MEDRTVAVNDGIKSAPRRASDETISHWDGGEERLDKIRVIFGPIYRMWPD